MVSTAMLTLVEVYCNIPVFVLYDQLWRVTDYSAINVVNVSIWNMARGVSKLMHFSDIAKLFMQFLSMSHHEILILCKPSCENFSAWLDFIK